VLGGLRRIHVLAGAFDAFRGQHDSLAVGHCASEVGPIEYDRCSGLYDLRRLNGRLCTPDERERSNKGNARPSERKDGEASEYGDGIPRFPAAAKDPQSHRENGVSLPETLAHPKLLSEPNFSQS
jgi:hypothetical protein